MKYTYMEWHESVLVQEVLGGLAVKEGDIILDVTAGDGGHLSAFCDRYGDSVELIGTDADGQQIARAKERLSGVIADNKCRVTFVVNNFRDLDQSLKTVGHDSVDKILFDLGWSTPQIEQSGRGFSFRRDEPLKMMYASEMGDSGVTAETVVNSWDEKALRTIIRGYGEERFAGRIARCITEARERKRIESTKELAQIIEEAVPVWYRHGRLHSATLTFQAIRMAVNDEITVLEEGLRKSLEVLSPDGRVAVISFHSLEDRIVKRQFREWSKEKLGTIVTKKPVGPDDEEREANPRSRSAKLRIFQKNPAL
ncbi:MAG: 16S rRNA (cytosine(1402)-N(4))-methyltransferase RsmH [Candidatus Paceibacterota bacterium]